MSDSDSPTRCCVMTPIGTAGIATVQVAGTHALAKVQSCFRGKHKLAIGNRLYHGRLCDPHNEMVIDEVVVACLPVRPDMPAEQTVIEIHSHGGRAVVAKIGEVLQRLGVQVCDQEIWYRQIGYTHAIEQAALQRFINSDNELAAKVFLHQSQGFLRHELELLRRDIADGVHEASARLAQLLATCQFGMALVTPPHIVIAGAPNVGKSTLLNRLLGRERALVDPLPGTTRDVISEPVLIQGMRFRISDTAGIRASDDTIERLGISRSEHAIQQADVTIWLCCADDAPQDKPPACPPDAIIVVNKIDISARHIDAYRRFFPHMVPVSALSGEGIDNLQQRLIEPFRHFLAAACAPIVWEQWQRDMLLQAQQALQAGDNDKAGGAIARMLC